MHYLLKNQVFQNLFFMLICAIIALVFVGTANYNKCTILVIVTRNLVTNKMLGGILWQTAKLMHQTCLS